MKWLGRLLGKVPPTIPPGAKITLTDNQTLRSFGRSFEWRWAYVMPGDELDDVTKQHKIGPSFTDLGEAQKYGDFLRDPEDHPFTYPTGAV